MYIDVRIRGAAHAVLDSVRAAVPWLLRDGRWQRLGVLLSQFQFPRPGDALDCYSVWGNKGTRRAVARDDCFARIHYGRRAVLEQALDSLSIQGLLETRGGQLEREVRLPEADVRSLDRLRGAPPEGAAPLPRRKRDHLLRILEMDALAAEAERVALDRLRDAGPWRSFEILAWLFEAMRGRADASWTCLIVQHVLARLQSQGHCHDPNDSDAEGEGFEPQVDPLEE